MNLFKGKWAFTILPVAILSALIMIRCSKNNNTHSTTYAISNSLTLFKIDNINNDKDILSTDTIPSMSGIQGKYIPVSGNAGAKDGLGKITFQLLTTNDSLLSSKEITSFLRPEYGVFNTQLDIPKPARGHIYKILVTSFDKASKEIGKKTFFGIDVLTCDPAPACIVTNQITIMLETPAGTPDESIYIFGSINGWGSRNEPQYMFHKNPDMANCYCLSIPYAPGYSDWQLTQIFVSRGTWATQAVTDTGAETYWNYVTTDRGPIWKIHVTKWRDQ